MVLGKTALQSVGLKYLEFRLYLFPLEFMGETLRWNLIKGLSVMIGAQLIAPFMRILGVFKLGLTFEGPFISIGMDKISIYSFGCIGDSRPTKRNGYIIYLFFCLHWRYQGLLTILGAGSYLVCISMSRHTFYSSWSGNPLICILVSSAINLILVECLHFGLL